MDTSESYRAETDSMGRILVKQNQLCGAQTLRSLHYFANHPFHQKAHREALTLRAAALEMGTKSENECDAWTDPRMLTAAYTIPIDR